MILSVIVYKAEISGGVIPFVMGLLACVAVILMVAGGRLISLVPQTTYALDKSALCILQENPCLCQMFFHPPPPSG